MTPLELLGISGAGLLAGAINTIAGGGSLLTLPVLILAGLPADVANGTNRIGVFVQSGSAAYKFHSEEVLDVALAWRLLIPSSIGAILGALLSVDIPEDEFEVIIGLAMLLILPFVLWKPHQRAEESSEEAAAERPLWVQALVFFGIGIYGGFLQAGVGVFLLTGLVLAAGQDMVRANAVKVVLVMGFTVPVTAIFLWHDLIAWIPGMALSIGSIAGGWLGSKLTVSWGPKFVRVVLIGVVIVSASKLLGVW